MEKKLIYGLGDLDQAVSLLKDLMDSCVIFSFSGGLGAGKTTLIRALLRACGVQTAITSPTFSYINVYHNKLDQKFYHFDLYRIASLDEFIAQGFDEYLYRPHSWVFIEWPEIVEPILKERVCRVFIDHVNETRKLVCTFSA